MSWPEDAGIRHFQAKDSKTEEPFVAGVDPGLKNWLKVRQAGRDAKLMGSKVDILVCTNRYKLEPHWKKQFLHQLVSEVEHKKPKQSMEDGGDEGMSNKEGENNIETQIEKRAVDNEHSVELSEQQDMEGKSPPSSLFVEPTVSLIEFKSMLTNRCCYEDILSVCIEKRNTAFIRLAVKEHGIPVDYRMGYHQRTMLHMACLRGDRDKMEYLLRLGANVNARDRENSLPLHLLIHPPSMFHPIDMIRRIIQVGSKLNVKDKRGHTPLHRACIVNSAVIIELLLAHHAHPYLLDKKDMLALDHAKSLKKYFLELVEAYSSRTSQERMWAHITGRNFVTSVMKVATPSCETCLRTLPDCLKLKNNAYRYWLFAHHRLKNEVLDKEKEVRDEARAMEKPF
mmetsp:Transcript_21916/g.36693  ORF Transcript_21916/g.36693 Transcript_21916/m.36693 type:complete len:397 (+) Transcript_21916:51-1241(+)